MSMVEKILAALDRPVSIGFYEAIGRGKPKPDRKEPSFSVSEAERAPSDGVCGIKGYYHLSRAEAIKQGIEVSPPATEKEKANV